MVSKSVFSYLKCHQSLRSTIGIISNRTLTTQVQPSEEVNNIEKAVVQLDPLKCPDYFKVNNIFTVKDLFDARVHYGHKEGSLNQSMTKYIYGSRLGHLIFDLDITAEHLRKALNFTAHVAYNGGIILFFMRGAQHAHKVELLAQECGEFAMTRYWRGGLFTNSTAHYGTVTRLPDLCIFFSTLNVLLGQHKAVGDSAKMLIPTIAIVDSNCIPNLITYPVPGNDDSPVAIDFYCKVFKEAIRRGKEERKKALESMDEKKK